MCRSTRTARRPDSPPTPAPGRCGSPLAPAGGGGAAAAGPRRSWLGESGRPPPTKNTQRGARARGARGFHPPFACLFVCGGLFVVSCAARNVDSYSVSDRQSMAKRGLTAAFGSSATPTSQKRTPPIADAIVRPPSLSIGSWSMRRALPRALAELHPYDEICPAASIGSRLRQQHGSNTQP